MGKKWVFGLNVMLLVAVVYLKFFNEATIRLINDFKLLQALMIFLVFYLTVYLISNLAKYFYSKKNKIARGQMNNVHFGIENIANFTISIGFFFLLLSLVGINPKDFVTSLTIVAAAFAILTKEYIVDFISGIYLSFSNTFQIGDYVKIDSQKGKIVEINMLKIKLLNDDEDVVIIPNSKVYYNEIINFSRRDVRLMNVDFQIALKYINNIEELEKELINALESFQKYIDSQSYNLKVVAMNAEYLDLKFQYTLVSVDMNVQRKIRRKTIRQVFNFISGKPEQAAQDELSQ